jgi:hypothetical protein
VTVPASTLTVNTQYKWTITPDSTASTPVWSKETAFWAYATPTLVFSATPTTISAKSYEFELLYTGTSPLKRWKMVWYDSLNEVVEDSGWTSSGNLTHTFDGFADGETASVKGFLENQIGQEVVTSLLTFSISYSKPSVNINGILTSDNNTSVLTSTWGNAVRIQGNHSSTPVYETAFLFDGNDALALGSGDSIYYELDILENYSTTFLCKPASGFTGVLCKMENSVESTYYEVGYDGARFYYDINGYVGYSPLFTIGTSIFLICIHPTSIYVKLVE